MWQTIKVKVAEGWKAVVALAIPILFGAAIEFVDALGQFVSDSGSVWAGVIVGVLTGAGVWLKANRPAA